MRHLLTVIVVTSASLCAVSEASAQLWEDRTESSIGSTAGWSNKVELADVNGDGRVDILLANGGNYSSAGTPETNRVFLNQGAGNAFLDASTEILGDTPDLARVIKARDLNGDGLTDIVVGTTYQTQSRLFLSVGAGVFEEKTATHLPAALASIGDLEVGDIDNDGDLDLVLVDWGAGSPFQSQTGHLRVWLNDGEAHFTEASEGLPPATIEWSWDLELLDTDNDLDLDIAVSCKVCTGSFLFLNEGTGSFVDARERMPQFSNNYEFEPADLNGDGFFDLITINDGVAVSGSFDRREHVFLADGSGGYLYDAAAQAVWPDSANLGADDNAVVVLDVESDGDPDFLIASLGSAPDRLLVNDAGVLRLETDVFDGPVTPGTLGIAVADLDGDGRLDVVQAQGEAASPDKVYFGKDVAVDTAAPIVDLTEVSEAEGMARVRVRVHDNKTPVMPHDFSAVVVERVGGTSETVPMTWYGGSLWVAELDPMDAMALRVCASDARGNQTCGESVALADSGCVDCDAEPNRPAVDAGGDPKPQENSNSGCGCHAGSSAGSLGGLLGLLLAAVGLRRRRWF